MADDAQTRIWALLVGIDEFAAQGNLDGCKNDVEAMRNLLVGGYGVPAEQVKVLTDLQATRDGIISTFRSFLIENDDIARGDQIMFHFSGHGANMIDPLDASPSGYIESLVAQDSGLEGIFNIPDTTVGALLDLLADAKGENITVVLDCCHSGSGTRNADKQAPKVRLTEPDKRVPPGTLDAEIVGAARALGNAKRWREEGLPYTLLAGCRDRELAQEYIDYGSDEMLANGAFSFFLVEALWRLQGDTSYAMLHEAVAAEVNAYNPYQMPQVEGNLDRAVLGSVEVPRDPFITVTGVQKGQIVLAGGRLHGIGRDATVDLYPKDVQTIDALPDAPIATAVVTSVTPTTALAYAEGADPDALLLARALVTDPGAGAPKRTVAFRTDGASDQAKAALTRLETLVSQSQWVRPAEDGRAEFLVWAEDEGLVIRGAAEDRALVRPAHLDGEPAKATLKALESLCRFRRVAGLRNDDRGSRLQGKLRMRIRQYVEGANPKDMPIVEPTEGELVLNYDATADENLYMVEVINDAPKALYANVLFLNADYSIMRLYPSSGGEVAIDPGESLFVGHTSPDELMDVYLPGDEPGEALWTVARNQLKLIATLKPTDVAMLEQHGLDVPPPIRHRSGGLEDLLSASVAGHRMGRRRKKGGEDWATAELAYTVVRQGDAIDIAAGSTELADGIVLEAPAGFSATVEVTTLGQATRGSAPGLVPPPGLARDAGFAPLGRKGTRGVGDNGLVVSLKADGARLDAIGEDNPLRLKTPGGGELWPIVFDGKDYLLAGQPDGDGVAAITRLPGPDGPASRGALSRTIQLFFYKKQGGDMPSVGLKRAILQSDGAVIYSDVQPSDVPAGSKSLLLVHGFASGTLGQVRTLQPALADLGYDTILTFDYESLGTGIAENGKALYDGLVKAGFGKGGRTLHVVAHSMGGLVARAMIEINRGDAFVDKLAMAGTPNGGTRLYDVAYGAIALVDMALNKVLGPASGVVLRYLFKQVKAQAIGPSDLENDSPFLASLNTVRSGTTPYLVLAGASDLAPDEDTGTFKRLALKGAGLVLDTLFGEAHDLVVGDSDIRGVQGGRYSKLTVEKAACNHFSYYLDAPSVAHIKAFLGDEAA